MSYSVVQMAIFDRAGNARQDQACVGVPGEYCFDSEWRGGSGQFTGQHDRPIQVVAFNPADELIAPSAALGLPDGLRMEYPPDSEFQLAPLPLEGSFHARPAMHPLNVGVSLVSNEGTYFRGAPAIPVVFQRYVNGVLQGSDGIPQRANYSIAFSPASWAWDITWDDIGDN